MKKNWLYDLFVPDSRNSTAFTFGLIAFAVFLFFSLFYIQERWLYTDSAFTFFRILNLDNLYYDRYSNAIQTWPSQFAAQKNAGAGFILYLINLTPLLFAALLFLIANRISTAGLWLIPLAFISQGGQEFFMGYNELLFALLFFAFLCSDFSHLGNYRLAIPLIAGTLLLFAHPATVLLVPFLCFLYWSRGDKISFWTLIVVAIVYLGKPLFLESNSYDTHMIHRLENADNWFNFLNHYSWQFFTSNSMKWLLIPQIVLVIVLISLLITKEFKKVIFLLLSLIFILIVSLVAYGDGDATPIMEKYFHLYALACFASVVFLKPGIWPNRLVAAMLAITAFIFSNSVLKNAPYYSGNLAMVKACEAEYQKKGKHKVLVNLSVIQKNTDHSVWALPYETMLVSVLEKRNMTVNVKPVESGNWKNTSDLFHDSTYGTAEFLPPLAVTSLNPAYFHLPAGKYFKDTSINYNWLDPQSH